MNKGKLALKAMLLFIVAAVSLFLFPRAWSQFQFQSVQSSCGNPTNKVACGKFTYKTVLKFFIIAIVGYTGIDQTQCEERNCCWASDSQVRRAMQAKRCLKLCYKGTA